MALVSGTRWWFDSENGASDWLIARWLFLRAIGLIYFSAFYSLLFQITGLIGPRGVLPANEYLQAVARAFPHLTRLWFAPTLLWFGSGDSALLALCCLGMAASLLLTFNLWPRATLLACFVSFLSFVSAAQDFSGYQSDGMLLEAGFLCLFFAPAGFRPGWGRTSPPSRASLFMLRWEWFCVYFGSGVVKLASGDPQWRNMTAMDEYYQNGPLPTWVGWYVQHLPHWFHAFAAYATLALELGLVWMLFLPRRWRLLCFLIVTVWQIPVILTANYTFLNYLVLFLGILLVDDGFLTRLLPARWRAELTKESGVRRPEAGTARHTLHALQTVFAAVMMTWIFYSTAAQLVMTLARVPLPTSPITALEPFRIADRYGLFAVMTRGRYEIEFQGSPDGENWTAYPFRYKPQDLSQAPRIYAPYQPRFDWNLWFASLGSWREYPIVTNTEVQLLSNNRDVLSLFAANPFPSGPPRIVRAVLWQYWFTSMAEKHATGHWWRRQFLGLYAPALRLQAEGRVVVVEWPSLGPAE